MGQYCKIVYLDSIPGDNADERLFGKFDDATYSIYIEDGQPHERERDTLVHEVLHQLFSKSGVDFKGDQEETVVSYLGGALLAHIRENKKFWDYVLIPPPPEDDDEQPSDVQ